MAVRIGGQAVIEGVMMKNMDRYAVSVRKPDGKIETKVEECVSFAEKHPLFKLQILFYFSYFLNKDLLVSATNSLLFFVRLNRSSICSINSSERFPDNSL